MIIEWRVRAAPFNIPFQAGASRGVQGHSARCFKLALSDHQTIGRDVCIAQCGSFRDPQPGAGQQRKQRAVGVSTQRRPPPALGGGGHETLDILARKTVRSRPQSLLAALDRQRQFMAGILRSQMPGESNHSGEPGGALMNR